MTIQGKRLVLDGDGLVQVESYAVAPPTAHQLLIRVAYSQVSAGSEMNAMRQHRRMSPEARSQNPARGLGYTTVGRVIARGEEVRDWAIDERVLCFGHHGSHWTVNLEADDTGGDIIPNQNLAERVPSSLTDPEVAFAVLGDVALHGVRRAEIQIGESVAVHGLGAVGLLAVQLARRAGAHPIIAVDVVDKRLDLARSLGASHAVNAAQVDPVAEIHKITRLPHTWTGWLPGLKPGTGAEVQIQATSNIQTYDTMLKAAADRGRLAMVGAAQHTAALGAHELLRRELTVRGSYQTGQLTPHPYWPWTRARNRATILGMIARGDLAVQPLISHIAPYTEAATVYDLIDRGSAADWLSVFFDWT